MIEDQLRRESIPYHIVGGIKFYDRKEIKDVLAYLKYILNPSDTIAFKRIVNFPVRGIGDTSINKIINYSIKENLILPEALNKVDKINIGKKQKEQLNKFNGIIKNLQKTIDKTALNTVELLVDEISLKEYYINKDNPEDLERLENIEELKSSISDFCDRNENNSINSFIVSASLHCSFKNILIFSFCLLLIVLLTAAVI